MNDDHTTNSLSRPDDGVSPPDMGAATRALAEAEVRRAERRRADQALPREVNGRQGPEPVRYGDWENKGIASDF